MNPPPRHLQRTGPIRLAIAAACAGTSITAPALWGAIRRLAKLHEPRSTPTA